MNTFQQASCFLILGAAFTLHPSVSRDTGNSLVNPSAVNSLSTHYYIGSYQGMAVIALQFAALRAAPHRYDAILSDCVEFSKEFCVVLLSYCSNWKQLEKPVSSCIKEASATGHASLHREYSDSLILVLLPILHCMLLSFSYNEFNPK